MVAPLLLAIVVGTISYGYLFWVHHGVQQLASEAARAAVAGLTDAERAQIAQDFVAGNAAAYGVLEIRRMRVSTAAGAAPASTFQVALDYDLTGFFIYQFSGILPLPGPRIRRTAVIQRGGY